MKTKEVKTVSAIEKKEYEKPVMDPVVMKNDSIICVSTCPCDFITEP